MINVSSHSYDSEATWLEARRNRIGASDAAAILGASRYESPMSLYFEKLGLAAPEESVAEQRRQWMRIGQMVEPVVHQLYVEGRPESREILTPPPYTLFENPEFPDWMTCTPDRLIQARALGSTGAVLPLELKNVDWRLGFEWIEEPPLTYIIQLQHQMAVLGADSGVLAALVGGNSFRWVELERDDEFIDRVLVPALASFHKCLLMQTPPEPDASRRTWEAIKAAYPRHVPNRIVALPGELVDWDERRQLAAKRIKLAEDDKREAESRLMLALGDAERGELPNGVAYTHKTQSRKESVMKASTFRVLRRSDAKGESDA